jgi:Skp family chaperone for outer membrane proteins
MAFKRIIPQIEDRLQEKKDIEKIIQTYQKTKEKAEKEIKHYKSALSQTNKQIASFKKKK